MNVLTSGLPLPNYNFGRILVFNIVWTFTNVFFHVVLGVLIAVALNTKNLPGKRIYRSLFVIPWALPSLVSGMVWANMWHDRYGAVNLCCRIGLPGNIRWLPDTTPVVNLPTDRAGASLVVLRGADCQRLAGLAVHDVHCHRCVAEYSGRAIRSRRRGWRLRLAEVLAHHAADDPARDGARHHDRHYDDVQPVQRHLLRDGRRAARA